MLSNILTDTCESKPVDVNVVTQLLAVSSQHCRVFDRRLRHLVLMLLCLQCFILLITKITVFTTK